MNSLEKPTNRIKISCDVNLWLKMLSLEEMYQCKETNTLKPPSIFLYEFQSNYKSERETEKLVIIRYFIC